MRDETLRLVVLVGFFVGVVLFAAVCHELKSLQSEILLMQKAMHAWMEN